MLPVILLPQNLLQRKKEEKKINHSGLAGFFPGAALPAGRRHFFLAGR
jgi:hypothetical protein